MNNLLEHRQGIDSFLRYLRKNEKDMWLMFIIDVDVYNWNDDKRFSLLQKAIKLGLVPANSKSGGIHLWCFSKVDVLAKHMRNYLCWVRDELDLDSKTEIFPKN